MLRQHIFSRLIHAFSRPLTPSHAFLVLDMKKAGYTCTEVKEAGFVEGIKKAGYTCREAKIAGFSVELKRCGYTVADLKRAGSTFAECKAAGFIKGLKAAGYTVKDAKKARFPARLLRSAGFSCVEAASDGYKSELSERSRDSYRLLCHSCATLHQ